MTDTVDSVAAMFGGRKLTFRIGAENIETFEWRTGMPAFQLFAKLAGGLWTMYEIRAVLCFGLFSPRIYARFQRCYGGITPVSPDFLFLVDGADRDIADFVAGVLTKPVPFRYVQLATRVLEASLFGLKPEDAVFDENAVQEMA